jgi:hypothetical protein
MYLQLRLQAYNALLNKCTTEEIDIQDSNMAAARNMVGNTESDLDY